MDPDRTINMLFCIHLDDQKIIPSHAICDKLVQVQGMGVKKTTGNKL